MILRAVDLQEIDEVATKLCSNKFLSGVIFNFYIPITKYMFLTWRY